MFCSRHMCRQTSPVVYEIGGYLVSPVNSILSYFARIHCSLKTLQMKSKTYTARQKLQTTRARFIKSRSSSRNPSIFHFYSHWLHFSLFLWQCPVSSLWLWDTNIPLWRHEPVTRSEEHEYPGKILTYSHFPVADSSTLEQPSHTELGRWRCHWLSWTSRTPKKETERLHMDTFKWKDELTK